MKRISAYTVFKAGLSQVWEVERREQEKVEEYEKKKNKSKKGSNLKQESRRVEWTFEKTYS